MTSYMLDTNICSFIIRARPPETVSRLERVASGNEIVVSAVTYFELRSGVLARQSPALDRLVAAFVARLDRVVPWDREAADEAARIHTDLAAKGMGIGGNDTMIAAHALAAGCVLVTNNTREFERVEGLRFEDWA